MKLDNMTEGQRADWLATMRYINDSAICSSLLYDLGLLPEQIEDMPKQDPLGPQTLAGFSTIQKTIKMLSVVGHIQKLEQDHAGQLEAMRVACLKAQNHLRDIASPGSISEGVLKELSKFL